MPLLPNKTSKKREPLAVVAALAAGSIAVSFAHPQPPQVQLQPPADTDAGPLEADAYVVALAPLPPIEEAGPLLTGGLMPLQPQPDPELEPENGVNSTPEKGIVASMQQLSLASDSGGVPALIASGGNCESVADDALEVLQDSDDEYSDEDNNELPPPRKLLIARALGRVSTILPDIEPRNLLARVDRYVDTMGDETGDYVLGIFLDMEAMGVGYPRVEKNSDSEPGRLEEQFPQRVDEPALSDVVVGMPFRHGANYFNLNRPPPSRAYHSLAMHYLLQVFPHTNKKIMENTLADNNYFVAPTFMFFAAEEQQYFHPGSTIRMYKVIEPRHDLASGVQALANTWCEHFGQEWLWLEMSDWGLEKVDQSCMNRYCAMRAAHGVLPEQISGGPAALDMPDAGHTEAQQSIASAE